MKHNIQDYIGKKIYHLTVIGKKENQKSYKCNDWIFKCECGNEIVCIPSKVISGSVRSCGCFKNDGSRCSGDEFRHTWECMMNRCYKPSADGYQHYGGRGIQVCDEWHDPANFVKWAHETAGHKTKELTLDRIDTSGPYCPENCRWATAKQQQRNKRNTRYETINGVTKPFMEWCEIYEIDPNVVRLRTDSLGWTFDRAITEKIGSSKSGQRGGTYVEIDGESKKISHWCKFYGISLNMVLKRIDRGWNPIDAIKTRSKR